MELELSSLSVDLQRDRKKEKKEEKKSVDQLSFISVSGHSNHSEVI